MQNARETLLVTVDENEDAVRPGSRSGWVVAVLVGAFLTWMAVGSQGFIEPYDEVLHFLYAKRAYSDPNVVLNIWGRLGCNLYYGLFAPFGYTAARMGAVMATMATGVGGMVVLRHFLEQMRAEGKDSFFVRHGAAMLWVLLLAQPFFTLFSFSVMTEMLLAVVWIWTVAVLVLARERRWRGVMLAGFLLGLGGLIRPEGWVAIACWPVFAAVWLGRSDNFGATRAKLVAGSTVLAGLPTLAWYLAGVAVSRDWGWIVAHWPWPAASQFGKTGLLFLQAAVVSQGIWLWPFIGVGAIVLWRGRAKGWRGDALLLLGGPVAGFYLMHGVLGNLGLFGSLSLPRYFICVAPMAAGLALIGLIEVEVWAGKLAWMVRTGPMVLVAALLLFFIGVGYLPTAKNLAVIRMDAACGQMKWLVGLNFYRVAAGHPYMLMELGMAVDGPGDMRRWDARDIERAQKGTVLVVEEYLWESRGMPGAEQLQAWGYRKEELMLPKFGTPWRWEAAEYAEVSIWVKTK